MACYIVDLFKYTLLTSFLKKLEGYEFVLPAIKRVMEVETPSMQAVIYDCPAANSSKSQRLQVKFLLLNGALQHNLK